MVSIQFGIEYDKVYIDFESCFKELDKVNTFVMMYLYQCMNKKIDVNLLVKDKQNTENYLKSKKISSNLFSKIIETESSEIEEILEKRSILLSNDYELKNKVRKNNAQYYCFSDNIVEALIDWRA